MKRAPNKAGLSADFVGSVLSLDPSTGIFTWRVNKARNAKMGDRAGTVTPRGYVQIIINRRSYMAHRLAWLVSYGVWPDGEIDHINRVKTDNRLTNLRECSASQNQANTGIPHANSTGYRGVSRSGQKFRAHIKVNQKSISLGTFDSATEAARAYDAAAALHFGEFAYHQQPSDNSQVRAC